MKTFTISALIIAFLLAGCGPWMAQREYKANQGKWQEQAIAHYRYQLAIGCFCPFGGQMPLTIEVKDGKAVSIKTADGSDPGPNAESYAQVDTIDKLFDKLGSALGEADEVTVSYDPTYGFPTSINIDYIKLAVDDETGYQVTNFEILPTVNP